MEFVFSPSDDFVKFVLVGGCEFFPVGPPIAGGRLRTLGHFEVRPQGQHFEGFAKSDAFPFHDETEAIATGAAGPALERLAIDVNHHRGIVIVVKRAQALELAAASLRLERNRFGDQRDDVGSAANLFFKLLIFSKDRHAQRSTQTGLPFAGEKKN